MLSSTDEWKRGLVSGLDAAKNKLSTYYKKTHDMYGDFYNFDTILNPMSKLNTYKSSDWGPKYAKKFKADFIKRFNDAYATDSTTDEQQQRASDLLLRTAPLAYMPLPRSARRAANVSQAEEYLAECELCPS